MEQQREFRIVHANESWNTNYNGTMLIESNSLNDRLAMIEKKENNIMKQYEMNEETIRNLKSNINTELHVSLKNRKTYHGSLNFARKKYQTIIKINHIY
jgi:hypothetical protein